MKEEHFNEFITSVKEGAALLYQHKAIELVVAERKRQDNKFGANRNIPMPLYLAILTEEVGELAQAVVDDHFGGDAASGLFEEAVHTAAVSLAIVEMLMRQGVNQ